MDKNWIKSYPPGVPADISIEHVPSLVALFEDAGRITLDPDLVHFYLLLELFSRRAAPS